MFGPGLAEVPGPKFIPGKSRRTKRVDLVIVHRFLSPIRRSRKNLTKTTTRIFMASIISKLALGVQKSPFVRVHL